MTTANKVFAGIGVVLALLVAGAVAGDGEGGGGARGDEVVAATETETPEPTVEASTSAPEPEPADETETTAPKKAVLPNLVGQGLQSAQDNAQAAGFFILTSHDSLGRDRMQVLDRNWKVCFQDPAAPGELDTSTTVDLGAVKLEETCPAKDTQGVEAAGSTMPDFVGESMKAARGALDSSTSITTRDVSGQDRLVFMESNWKVCSHTPSAGAELTGQPVQFDVVKFEESCP